MVTAVVLSGGGSLGAVQAGMLLALFDAHVTADVYVGSSVGALNAAYIAGEPDAAGARRLAQIWRTLRREDVFPTDAARVLRAMIGRTSGLTDPHPLRELVQRNLNYERLEEAAKPVVVVATDVLTGREVALGEGAAVDAVMASAALPSVFPPVNVGPYLLMDGGVVNNTPISVARQLGADIIYVLPTGYACALESPPRSALGMGIHAVTLAIQQRLIADVAELQGSLELRVAPPLCPLAVSPIDFTHTAELIERARTTTAAWLEQPVASDQARDLALHAQHTSLASAGSKGPR
jgi:NTE family protein